MVGLSLSLGLGELTGPLAAWQMTVAQIRLSSDNECCGDSVQTQCRKLDTIGDSGTALSTEGCSPRLY